MIVRDQYGTEVFSKVYIPSPNVLAPGQSTTFAIRFISDDVSLVERTSTGVIPDRILDM